MENTKTKDTVSAPALMKNTVGKFIIFLGLIGTVVGVQRWIPQIPISFLIVLSILLILLAWEGMVNKRILKVVEVVGVFGLVIWIIPVLVENLLWIVLAVSVFLVFVYRVELWTVLEKVGLEISKIIPDVANLTMKICKLIERGFLELANTIRQLSNR